MAGKRSGEKAKSSSTTKHGDRKPKKEGLKDLEAKDGRRVRGGAGMGWDLKGNVKT